MKKKSKITFINTDIEPMTILNQVKMKLAMCSSQYNNEDYVIRIYPDEAGALMDLIAGLNKLYESNEIDIKWLK